MTFTDGEEEAILGFFGLRKESTFDSFSDELKSKVLSVLHEERWKINQRKFCERARKVRAPVTKPASAEHGGW